MKRSDLAIEHENGLALFISPEWRARFRESLAGDARRDKALARLSHFRHLDSRFAQVVPQAAQQSRILGPRLRERGAPSRCYVVSGDPELDGRVMLLEQALADIVDRGVLIGTFISCIPAKLAYFHDEELGNRYILERP